MKRATSAVILIFILAQIAGCNNVTPSRANKIKGLNKNTNISYLGPEGTYTHEACMDFFQNEGKYIPYKTVNDAVKALTDGECEYAVIPQENTIGGAVTDYIDTLIDTPGVYVTGEVILTVNQNLLVMPGAELSGIRTVYSHKQGIEQCKEWLKKNLPDAGIVEVSSTAEGAKIVSETKDPSKAAIASAGCAEVYGLENKAAAIQNNDKNKTRFYVLTKKQPDTEDKSRLAFIVKGPASYLPSLLADISKNNGTLITIHDRPLKTELGEYNYVIETEGLSYQDYCMIEGKTNMVFRFLGCY